MNTTQPTLLALAADLISTSRGLGRMAARSRVGKGPKVVTAALRAARAQYPTLDAFAFMDGFSDERHEMGSPVFSAA